jgi:uncharacterized membrane-anchored protein YjiN (DUF445 family)
MFAVEVKTSGEYTTHSTHDSYKDAVDQADMVRGRVVAGDNVRLTIVEIDQTIEDCLFRDWDAPNDFLRDLVAESLEEGSATREDEEGCPVTATIHIEAVA